MSAEDQEQFDESIGMRADPAQIAKDALKRHQEEQGMTFDNPDAPVGPDAKALAQMEEKELGEWMGGGKRGQ